MTSWKGLPDASLARRGRDLVRRGEYKIGLELLTEYCSRTMAQGQPVGPSVMASYGLAIGMTGDLQEGFETCQRALSIDRRNAEIWAAIARLSLKARMKKKAVEAIEHGLAITPRSRELLELREELGARRKPLVPFLPRESSVNVRLGRVLHRLFKGARRGPTIA